jgi:hypothetical protein
LRGGLPDCESSFAGPVDFRGMSQVRFSRPCRLQDSAPRDRDCPGYFAAFPELTGYQSGGILVCLGCGNGAQLVVLHPLPAALIRRTDLRRHGSVEPPLAFDEAARSGGASRKNTLRRRHPLC